MISFVGSFLLRVVPIPQSYDPLPGSLERSGSDASTLLQLSKSGDSKHSARRLSHEPGMQPEEPSSFIQHEAPSNGTEETSSLLSKSSGSYSGDAPCEEEETKGSTDHDSHHLDIRGLALLSHVKFYILWMLMGLFTGLGLQTINNIGSNVGIFLKYLLVSLSLLTKLTGSSDMASLRRQCLFRVYTETTTNPGRNPFSHELLWTAHQWYVMLQIRETHR